MKPITFPRDGLEHNNTIEWWYFNGHLQDKKGNKYSYMDCLFKVNLKSLKLPFLNEIKRIPFLNKIPLKDFYFSHSLVSDIKNQKFYPRVDYISLVSKDSFKRPLLFVNYTSPIVVQGYVNSVIEEIKPFVYHIKTEDLDLKLTSIKKPLLEGGNGYVDVKSKKTYYYSLTNLKTEGTIKIKNKLIPVTGKSWMDHQWADIKYPAKSQDKWTWFSIQLDNNVEMVCFEYDDGDEKTYIASIMNAKGKQEDAKDLRLISTGKRWTSRKSGKKYSLNWKIEIPSKNIYLEVEPFIKSQEMDFGSIEYWEGPLKVKGTYKNKKTQGLGFMELVGRPFQMGDLNFILKSGLNMSGEIYSESRKLLPF